MPKQRRSADYDPGLGMEVVATDQSERSESRVDEIHQYLRALAHREFTGLVSFKFYRGNPTSRRVQEDTDFDSWSQS
jgi:hypothetical protein